MIKNGKIVSGSGNPWYKADIGIIGDTISFIGDISKESANKVIDADGLIVSPGFIDEHSHRGLRILGKPTASEKLFQGITTEVNGQCGVGISPIKDEDKKNWREYVYGVFGEYLKVDFNWNTFGEYLKEVEKIILNLVLTIKNGRRKKNEEEKKYNFGNLISYMDRMLYGQDGNDRCSAIYC